MTDLRVCESENRSRIPCHEPTTAKSMEPNCSFSEPKDVTTVECCLMKMSNTTDGGRVGKN